MKRYKAVVIDTKRLMKKLFKTVLIAAISFGLIFIGLKAARKSPEKAMEILSDTIPVSDTDNTQRNSFVANIIKNAQELLLGFEPSNSKSVIYGSMPICKTVMQSGLAVAVKEEGIEFSSETAERNNSAENQDEHPSPIMPENNAPIKSIDASQKSGGALISIGNETSYSVDVNKMLSTRPDISVSADNPTVLITHTHATEAYASNGAEFYDITASDRDEDINKNVVAVGTVMQEVLEKNGIKTLHDTILHDAPSFNGSYAHSLNTVTEYLEKYPSIQVVFDIHRDSIVYDDNTKAKTVTEINSKKTAQLMFVVGTDEKGLCNPDWRYNMTAAVQFQKAICDKYPKLMRHINLRQERFNGHTTHASMIIEVGTSGNSLDEAKRGITYAAECIAKYMKNE